MKCGGVSDDSHLDDTTQSICDRVKDKAEEKAGRSFDVFKAVGHSKQVVAGTNHFIKVHVGEEEYVHLRVFEPLPYTKDPIELIQIQLSKTLGDKIEHF